MKRVTAFLLAIALVNVSLANDNLKDVKKHSVSAEKSEVTWKAYKVTGEHEGYLKISEASLDYADGNLVGGAFSIDATTITVTDLSGGMKEKLEGHLKSPDFFNVSEFPVAKFQITKVVSRGTAGDYKVIGELTLKGITKELKFNAHVEEKDGKPVSATADFQIDRTDFNVKYGSGSFFDNLGDKTIYDEFDLSISLVL